MTKLTPKHRYYLALAACLAYAAVLMAGMCLLGDVKK
jgi:hypothetical protein